ncbi:S24/S26 family peptidase [Dactylosporangium sp. AC04546]|uniref:S24/S26 family peptidase n=1 Tax=Dactylosporangium sp. AC04546 TaxID=2862460 RepID=UPI001EDF1742|nr:S24/S26 family peptidase [Dactylosporangium sp. AC04546]WVK82996.1 S24/S26 family peptidase [Dactylosporangium sp. AC04546]
MIHRLLLGVALSAVLFAVGVSGLGWRPYVVTSESMAPGLHAGDLVFVDPRARTVANYEVVVSTDRRGPVTHRVVGQAADGRLTLRADAGAEADPAAVERARLVGPVRLVLPNVGWPVVQVRTHPLRIAGGALLLALVVPGRRLLMLLLLGGLVAAIAMVPTTL